MIIHTTIEVTGDGLALVAFAARLKELLAEHGVAGEVAERHTARALHYDLKVEGGIPFPPFALASGEFSDVTVAVEWFDAGKTYEEACELFIADQKVTIDAQAKKLADIEKLGLPKPLTAAPAAPDPKKKGTLADCIAISGRN